MSGYAGIISLDNASPDRALLDRMAAALAFRGPDATHITTQPGAGFVFTFLKTGPAPQSSQQPVTLDGRVWLIGDVRLDGRDDLRRKLDQFGIATSASTTDEELLLHAYQKWGEPSFPELLGDYAFALWDSTARRLLCLRDLIGSRPFFYAHAAGQLLFSNTLNIIRLAPQISADVDRHYIGDFLLEGWCPDLARSAFRDIARLPPGHVMSYSEGAVNVRRFNSFPIEEPLLLKRPEEYVERFRTLLEQAVRERLPQGPVSIFMSGGLDSTSVAAIALDSARKRAVPLDLRAYVVDYNPLFKDPEGALASKAARHLNIPIEVQSAASSLPYADWNDLAPWMPEPLHDPFRSISVTAIRRVAEHARASFTGYGGDGVMTGQSWPYLVDLFRRRRFTTVTKTFGTYLLRHHRLPPLRAGFRQRLLRIRRAEVAIADYPSWIAPDFEREVRLRDRWRDLRRPSDLLHPWHRSGYDSLVSPNWSGLLETDDAGWHGTPAQSRSPLLDQRLQRFLLRVPPVPHCIDKHLLRQAVANLLPNDIRLRRKVPLAGDPLTLHIDKNRWNPFPNSPKSLPICDFVSWAGLEVSYRNRSVLSPWRDSRPFSLLYWTISIANGELASINSYNGQGYDS